MILESISLDIKLIVNLCLIILILTINQSAVSPRLFKPMNSKSLREAVKSAQSTDIILIGKAGNYTGGITISSSGRQTYPITLTGPSSAVITCTGGKGAAIYLK